MFFLETNRKSRVPSSQHGSEKKLFTNKYFAKRKVFLKLADVYGYFKKIFKFHQQARKKGARAKIRNASLPNAGENCEFYSNAYVNNKIMLLK